MKVENEAALSQNETVYEKLRSDMEKNIKAMSDTIITKMMIGLGISVTFLSGVIAYVGLFLRP